MNKFKSNLIWLDLEMTGLDPEKERIIEIGTIVTNKNLDIIGQSDGIAIHQDDEILNNMDDWNKTHHRNSGLLNRVIKSKVSEKQAEEQIILFLEKYSDPGWSPICGNSVCQDKLFLFKYMPKLFNFFHYRMIDVSTIKELAKRWNHKSSKMINKKSAHTVISDINDSISELRIYRKEFFKF